MLSFDHLTPEQNAKLREALEGADPEQFKVFWEEWEERMKMGPNGEHPKDLALAKLVAQKKETENDG